MGTAGQVVLALRVARGMFRLDAGGIAVRSSPAEARAHAHVPPRTHKGRKPRPPGVPRAAFAAAPGYRGMFTSTTPT